MSNDYTDIRQWRAFDVETDGERREYALQPWSDKAWLTSFATAQINTVPGSTKNGQVSTGVHPQNAQVALAYTSNIRTVITDEVEVFLRHCVTFNYVVVGWNVAFDIAWLIKLGFRELVFKIRWLDAMLLWKKLTRVPEAHLPKANKKRFGLKEAVAEFYPQFEGYDADIDFHSMDPVEIEKRLQYNRKDAGLTFALARRFMHLLNQPNRHKQLRNAIIESKCIPLVADHYVRGLTVDRDEAASLGGKLAVERIGLRVELEAWGATEAVLASPAQLGQLLYEEWQLPILKQTPGGQPSTDKEALYELAFHDKRANNIKRYREIGTLKTKFVDNVLASCDYNEEDVTHPTAFIDSTYTGRMTFASSIGKNKAKRQTGFALHQMKRGPDFRRYITAPPGYGIAEWDAAGQEFRWVAIESMDPVMLGLCMPGEDPHSYMSAQMSPEYTYQQILAGHLADEKWVKPVRMPGKVGNLSCQYRIGWKSLLSTARVDYELPWDAAMAQHVHGTYRKTYTEVPKWWERKIRDAKRNGFAETIAGRRVILEGDWYKERWRLESSSINFPIQGVGADQKYLAMMCIQPVLTKFNGYFYFELHDGLYAIFPLPKLEAAVHAGRKVLSNMPYQKAWDFTPPIPLPWDAKMGLNWGDLKGVQ